MSRIDELVARAKELESLSEEITKSTKEARPAITTDHISNDWYWGGFRDGLLEVIEVIEKRTVTLMEQIYREEIFGDEQVPFDD